MSDARLADLSRRLPDLRLLTAAGDLEHYGRDWTRRWTPAPLAIALPASADEVQAIVRWANEQAAWRSCPPAAAPVCPVVRWRQTASWC